MTPAEEFRGLFVGGNHAKGEWSTKGVARTFREGPCEADYQAHLEGITGLGLVPVQLDGMCRFAAIDIDVDTINHSELEQRVTARKLPLIVCRSKSGGAHLYLFMDEPGLKAVEVRQTLTRWAALLGYPTAEIFPKQDTVSEKNIGNWINLPYFGGDSTTRYAVVGGRPLGLGEFTRSVKKYAGSLDAVDESIEVGLASMPPCLQALSRLGIPDGQRNQALFNFGVFFRKSAPADWEDRLVQLNTVKADPPLPNREIQTIVKSLSRVKYQYTCDLDPIRSHCSRTACLQLPFGVGHMPWKEEGTFDDLLVSHLRKILTDPPRYMLEVNGHDVTLDSEEFFIFRQFRMKILERLDMVVQPMKQERWEQTLKHLLQQREDVSAPDDAGPYGALLTKTEEFLNMHERQRDTSSILRGMPVLFKSKLYFRSLDLVRFLHANRIIVNQSELFVVLRRQGCEHQQLRVKGKIFTCWSMPSNWASQQTEEFEQEFFSEEDSAF